MGCKTNINLCAGGVFGSLATEHCANYTPGQGVTFEFREYPAHPIRTQNYNIPDRDANAVMYSSLELCTDPETNIPPDPGAANCGKVAILSPCDSTCTIYYDYYPTQLSFDFGLSDTWFAYLYDTSYNAGVAGTPCYHIEDKDESTTTPEVVDDPATPEDETTPGSSTTTSETICYPCTGFTCESAVTNLRYTADEDLTGDADCPHPTLFGFGTESNKLAFSYDSLSTILPNGVVDFEVSYDGVTYTDIWDEGILAGIPYESTQNPWQSGDESWADFHIFEIEDLGNNKIDFRIKMYLEPIFDDTGPTVVFSGTRWTVAEVMNAGTGYNVNDVFLLEYEHTHPDNSTTTLTLNLKITGIGPVSATAGQAGFDVLRVGDTLNGHTITRVFHTDLDNFAYHVLYLDGSGSDFVKETQYTSNRDHVITAKAGYGIKDRAILVGLYEFLDKSVQYVTADIDKNAPDIFNQFKQPEFDVTVTNGRVSSVTIVDGGENWNLLGNPPELVVTAPYAQSGTTAIVKGTFSGGVLTGIQVVDSGSGYLESLPPSIFIRNIFKVVTTTEKNEGFRPDGASDFRNLLRSIPSTESSSVSANDIDAIGDAYNATPVDFTSGIVNPTVRIKMDPDRNEIYQIPQYLYSENAVAEFKEYNEPRYSLRYLNDSVLDNRFKRVLIEEKENDEKRRNAFTDSITQKQIPEFQNLDATLVETVQGSLTNLPYGSTYTKYILRQYRPDSRGSNFIDITLSCSPVDEGCLHFSCSAPAGNANSSSTDPETGVVIDTTYLMSPLLGSGCRSWAATGTMKIFHNLTEAANTAKRAADAYGNPYL